MGEKAVVKTPDGGRVNIPVEILQIIEQKIGLPVGHFDRLGEISTTTAGTIAKLLCWGYEVIKVPAGTKIYVPRAFKAGVWGETFRSVQFKSLNTTRLMKEDGEMISILEPQEIENVTLAIRKGEVFALEIREEFIDERRNVKTHSSSSRKIYVGV